MLPKHITAFYNEHDYYLEEIRGSLGKLEAEGVVVCPMSISGCTTLWAYYEHVEGDIDSGPLAIYGPTSIRGYLNKVFEDNGIER